MPETKTIGELAFQTKLIIELLEQSEVGEQVTYSMLSDLIGENIQETRGRGLLKTAKGVVQRERGYIFDTIRGVGLVRVSEPGKSRVVDKGIIKVRRATRRTHAVLETVDVSALDKGQLSAHFEQSALLGRLNAGLQAPRAKEPPKVVVKPDVSDQVRKIVEKYKKV